MRKMMNFLPHLNCLQSLLTDLTEQSHSCQAASLLKKYEHMKELEITLEFKARWSLVVLTRFHPHLNIPDGMSPWWLRTTTGAPRLLTYLSLIMDFPDSSVSDPESDSSTIQLDPLSNGGPLGRLDSGVSGTTVPAIERYTGVRVRRIGQVNFVIFRRGCFYLNPPCEIGK